MPSAAPKSSMSPEELVTCEDFLDGHREYAIDLLSSIEKIHRWHGTVNCLKTREGKTCMLCGLCSADGDGLMGATKKALAAYKDAESHLKGVRASLGKSAPSRGAPKRDTLFRNNLAKAVFFCTATVGDRLRSNHAMWQARLQTEAASFSCYAQISTHLGDLDKIGNGDILLPTYSGPRFVSPGAYPTFTAGSTGLAPGTGTSSSMFVVVRRCLSSDCPCETSSLRTNAPPNANLGGACGSRATSKVPPIPSDSKKTRTSKATRSTTASARRRSKKTSDTSDALTQTKTDAQAQKPKSQSAPDTQIVQGLMHRKHESDTVGLTQEIGSSLECDASVVDPRAFRLRAQIMRSDDVGRALIAWCRSWTVDWQPHPRKSHGIGPTHESTGRDTHGYPLASTVGFETVAPVARESLCMTGQTGDVTMKGDDDETTDQAIQLDSEQEELKGRWLTARRNRFQKGKCLGKL